MHVGDPVVFLDDEPGLDLPEGSEGVVVEVAGPDDVTFQLGDGRRFVTSPSSLEAQAHG